MGQDYQGNKLFRSTNIFKFRVSVGIRFRVTLDYIRLDSIRLKVRLTILTPGVYTHLDVETAASLRTRYQFQSPCGATFAKTCFTSVTRVRPAATSRVPIRV